MSVAAHFNRVSDGSAIKRGLRWWGDALAACLPGEWRQLLSGGRQRVLLLRHDEEVTAFAEDERGTWPLHRVAWQEASAALPGHWQRVERHWLLPASSALQVRFALPAAAAPRLHDVVGFEMDRYTPFAREQVYYATRVLDTLSDGQLWVELIAVPRAQLASVLRSAWAGTLAGVEVADVTGTPLGVNVLPEQLRTSQRDPWRVWYVALAAAAVLMGVLAGQQWLDNRAAAVAQLRMQVERQALQARKVAAERQQLQALVDGAAFSARQRRERPAMTAVWDELTRRLPPDTSLERLAVEAQQLQLIGTSASASSLVNVLEGAPQWTAPALGSVLQAEPGSRGARFTLNAQLAGAGVAGGADAADRPTP